MSENLRIIIGLPFVLFIPGYLLIFTLFPNRKTDVGVSIIERIGLSFVISIIILPIIGLGLNYTTFGIKLETIFYSVLFLNIFFGITAIIRWIKCNYNERFIISFDIQILKSKSKLEKTLTILLIISIVITFITVFYVIAIPRTGEKFTEFYLKDSKELKLDNINKISIGSPSIITIGIINHEYKTIKYTIELWLVNQTINYNESSKKNETIYNHMYFIDKISIKLNHTPLQTGNPWKAQWEYKYTFSINEAGNYNLYFLLYKKPTNEYNKDIDYNSIAKDKISKSYRETNIYIEVK